MMKPYKNIKFDLNNIYLVSKLLFVFFLIFSFNSLVLAELNLSEDEKQWVKNNYIHISVTDTGKGLTKVENVRFFNSFTRLNAKQNIEGTDIGLTITKNIVELMGGEIGVESILGEGSTF